MDQNEPKTALGWAYIYLKQIPYNFSYPKKARTIVPLLYVAISLLYSLLLILFGVPSYGYDGILYLIIFFPAWFVSDFIGLGSFLDPQISGEAVAWIGSFVINILLFYIVGIIIDFIINSIRRL
jgi:hypothetical protein